MPRLNYTTMYRRAYEKTRGYYKGYDGANALCLYVSDKYKVNAVMDYFAQEALCEVMSEIRGDNDSCWDEY